MAIYPLFSGGFDTERSVNANAQDLVNWYPEPTGPGGKAPVACYPTPALIPYVGCGTGPIRGIFYQDGRAFAVSGAAFFEFYASQNGTFRGTVAVDGNPATMSSNGTAGNQLFITSGGNGYIFNLTTNVLTQIDPTVQTGFPVPCLMGQFSDGYFFALKGQSRSFSFSTLEDGTGWDALDVDEVSQGSDNLASFLVNHREITLFGTKTTEFWVDSGDANNPFAPLPGTFMEKGIIAPWSAVRLDNTIYFLGGDERGAGVLWSLQSGYAPTRVSTFAVETYINSLDRFDNAWAFAYEQDGHLFYVLYLPNADSTLVYDVSTQLWHKRGVWNPTLLGGSYQPWRAQCHAYAFGLHLVGDPQSGTIYKLDLNTYLDRLS